MNDFVLIVAGPTASGKTSFAVKLAENFNGEVIGADSMQLYKGMDIATAKPTAEEMRSIPHHLIGFLPPSETFSVAKYKELCEKSIADIQSRSRLPIICGGTGQYIDAVLNNTTFLDAPSGEYRKNLEKAADEMGIDVLFEELKKIDPDSASKLNISDKRRIIRALELYYSTGMTKQKQNELSHLEKSKHKFIMFCLFPADRRVLYDRIEKRIDVMLEAGLLDEARRFYESERSSTSVQAIGYKELKPYLDGEGKLDECVERLKIETRHYAKRQMTWFRRYKDAHIIYFDQSADPCIDAIKILKNMKEW